MKQYKKILITRPIKAQKLRPQNLTTDIAFKISED